MGPRMGLIVVTLVGVACSGFEVQPPPGLDRGQDMVTTDPGAWMEPGPGEVAPDITPCQRDDDCEFLLPSVGSECVKARCDSVKGCVLDNLPEGEPCGVSGRVPETLDCKEYLCDGKGQCIQVPVKDGTTCVPDGSSDPCSTYVCMGGECVLSLGCDDGNPCTEDSCVAEIGKCQHTPLTGVACEDDDLCTIEEACFAGLCLGRPALCDDGNPCTDDRCAKQTGCVHSPLTGTACDDKNACTRDDICQEGKCEPGAYVVCNDGNRCTTDQCNPSTGECEFTPTTSPCDDGNPCTEPDQCQGGLCVGMPKDCNDHDPCTADSCQPGTGCVHTVIPGCRPCWTNKDCDDGNPCTQDTCAAGECLYKALTGTDCSDGNTCTLMDRCEAGSCVPGPLKDCNDGNVCTDDSCDPATGQCAYKFNMLSCDDGNPCTLKDQCSQGSCTGTPVSCDDGNLCTDDFCETATGKCVNAYNSKSCDDGKFCTVNDKCSQGVCLGTVVTCNDNNPCTKDWCDEANDRCVNEPIAGCLSCTADKDCNDGNVCTQDKCVASKCEFTPLTGTHCDDGNKCTGNDVCNNGVCQPGIPTKCPFIVCHIAKCDPAQGCVYTPQTGVMCDDGDPCTGPDQCVAGQCVPGPLLCCEGRQDGTPCSDQDDSTGPDFCIGGSCRGFYVVPFQAAFATGLTSVDAAASPVGTGWYRLKGDQPPTGFVADLPFRQTPSVITATQVSGKVYRSVSSWLAVGDGGLVAYRTSWSTGWVVGGVLANALASLQPSPGNLTDVFGVLGNVLCKPPECCGGDSYLLIGRDASGTKAFARHCHIRQALTVPPPERGCSTEARCGPYAFQNLDLSATWPVAVAGLPAETCPGPCLSEAAIVSRVETMLGIFQSALSLGTNSGSFIENFLLRGFVATPGYQVRDAVRLPNDPKFGAVYVAVGDAGTFLVASAAGGPVQQVNVLQNQQEYNFTGIALNADYLFLTATRVKPKVSKDQVLILHPRNLAVDAPNTYFPMTIQSYVADAADTGGTHFSLNDVAAAGSRLTLVGDALIDNRPSGVVYFLEL